MQGSVPIAQPAGFVPVHASGFADGQGKAVTVSRPRPCRWRARRPCRQLGAAGGQHRRYCSAQSGAFHPAARAGDLGHAGGHRRQRQGATAALHRWRRDDGRADGGGDVWASWSFTGVTGSIVNEQVATESDAAASYYLAVTLSAGSLTYRIAQ
jgi:hypothetical protein